MTLGQLHARKRAPTAHDYVLSTLREAILSSRLPGGTRLVQSELASELDVSITPVREALRDLANEGLVTSDAHRGSRVRILDLAEVRELYELRIMLEPLMVRRSVVSVTTEQLDQADTIRQEMEATNEISVWSELNREFHAALNESDDRSRLTSILNGLRDGASAYVGLSLGASPERIAESNAEHAALVNLYREADTEAAIALTVQHLHTTLSTIEQAHERGLL
jgi:DNA-binding GntR family transcriptional regulator